MKLKANQRFVMIGDSVTDAGRARPYGAGRVGEELGTGYPRTVKQLLWTNYPELNLNIFNMGTSGNTSRCLKERWQSDLLDLNPDWVSVMIGINDVWRQFDSTFNPACHVLLDEYRENLEWIINQTLDKVEGFILMSPYYIEDNTTDAMRSRMDEYRNVCATLAIKYNLVYVDTQKPFDEYLKGCHSSFLSWDRVHPNLMGHGILAKNLLKAIDFKF